MTSITIVGVYPVKSKPGVHLIEVQVQNSAGIFNPGEFTQPIDSEPKDNWQVAYLEHILNNDGTKILADDLEASERPDLWIGSVRMVFFFHEFDVKKPLSTPFGDVLLPRESPMPKRLEIVKYEDPD
jgi:hypothetical protein